MTTPTNRFRPKWTRPPEDDGNGFPQTHPPGIPLDDPPPPTPMISLSIRGHLLPCPDANDNTNQQIQVQVDASSQGRWERFSTDPSAGDSLGRPATTYTYDFSFDPRARHCLARMPMTTPTNRFRAKWTRPPKDDGNDFPQTHPPGDSLGRSTTTYTYDFSFDPRARRCLARMPMTTTTNRFRPKWTRPPKDDGYDFPQTHPPGIPITVQPTYTYESSPITN